MPPRRRGPARRVSASQQAAAPSLVYPSGARLPQDLSPSEALLKVARHSPCSAVDGGCSCRGLRPSPDADVEAKSVHDRDEAAREAQCSKSWKKCGICGHEVAMHGKLNDTEGGEEEKIRRIKVAIRLDELLEDQKKLLDFAYSDEDQVSLQKQLVPLYRASPQPSHPAEASGSTPPKRPASPAASDRSSSPDLPLAASAATRRSPSASKRRKLGEASPFATPPASTGKASRAASEAYASPLITDEDDQSRTAQAIRDEGLKNAAAEEAATESEEAGQGHGKHPAQSSKGVADQAIGPEEALEKAEAQAQKELEEQQEAQRKKLAEPKADLDLVTGGISIDTVVEQEALEEAPLPRRERPAVVEERTGLIEFRVVSNAHLSATTPAELIILTGLKNIFQRQLPKMPREYITRLVLDKNHVSMAIVKRGLQVVGGITYRPFNSRKFAEIVFCAIDSSQQVKGYGQHLMNHLKDHVKESGDVMHFLTYADNYAIGYFKKQGFTKEISLPRSVWVGYIKDYEGGTLMQCSMVPRVKYLEVHDMLAKQRELVLNKIRSTSRSHIVHPGLEVFKKIDAERKVRGEEGPVPPPNLSQPTGINGSSETDPQQDSKAYLDQIKSHFKISPSEIPGLSESGWTPEMDVLSRRPKRGPHHGLMRLILVELTNHQSSWPFAAPVNADDVPDYYNVVSKPMDLATMETKLENNHYKNVGELEKDAQ